MLRFRPRNLRAAIPLAAALAALVAPAPASAGEYTVPFCTEHPQGVWPGWTMSYTAGTNAGLPYFYQAMNCNPGAYGFYRRFEINTIPAGATHDLVFQAPSGTHISRIAMSQSATPESSGAADAVYAYLEDGSRMTLAMAIGGMTGSTIGSATYQLPANGAKAQKIQSSLLCQPSANCSGRAPNGGYGNVYTISGGRVYLTDPSKPVASSVSGEGWQSDPRDGIVSVDYAAADTGSGVQEARLYVDGILVDSRASSCTPNILVPCPLSTSGTLAYDSRRYSEGAHTVALVLLDASGNATAASDTSRTVTLRRPPASNPSAPPSAGTPGSGPTAGTPVQGSTGSWEGRDLTFTYQWLRCDPSGQNCVPIDGATSLTYTPTSADVGRTLVLCVTASNASGSAERCSVPTAVVGAGSSGTTSPASTDRPSELAGGTPSASGPPATGGGGDRTVVNAVLSSRTSVQRVRFGRRVPIAGRLARPDGTPIAGATLSVQTQTALPGAAMADSATVVTDRDGRFTYIAAPGPSRLIRFAYRSQAGGTSYVDTTDVRLLVLAGVTLRASPRKVRNKQATVFSGRVLGRPIPRRGVLVDLQVFYRKKWRTFAAPRSTRTGRYRFKYRFTAGAASWKFRARVRPGTDYPYEQGLSRQRRVRVTW